MSKFLKFYLIIIILSFSALVTSKKKIKKKIKYMETKTKFYIDNFYNLTELLLKLIMLEIFLKAIFGLIIKKRNAFHYNPPYETVIIYKSGKLFFKERKSESFQNYSINNNPILELLENNSNINKYLNSSIIDGNIGKITINVNEGNERNSLEVVFDYPKPILRQWKYIDHQKKETNIFFSKLNFVESVQKQYFVTK